MLPCWCLDKRAPTHQLNPRRPQINPLEPAASVTSELFAFNIRHIGVLLHSTDVRHHVTSSQREEVTYIRW